MSCEKDSISLKEHFETLLNERDKRMEERFTSMQIAVSKAEVTTEKRFEAMNEFRAQLGDQARTFMPRIESQVLHDGANNRINEVMDKVRKMEDLRQGGSNLWGYIVGAIGVIGIIVATIIGFRA